ncbi:YceD family protein [Pseudogracilibacillus auburnensis]|uniref:DUF177 domain-containing protein n=1 Tax=Pseudogracilibacillus auburnensis TaxID=1494959 RepID=A0A2V3W340_9BACI|nr:YceD family protein [Pseudogracilibacillus auburnensis]MBO1003530.1 DUF177 domain-containing protein [Pseudogracilibacillus auburnensis]PXW88502.1 uncharacterized protein DFR56_1036 [Pseudogracilibacillus auburnensis]
MKFSTAEIKNKSFDGPFYFEQIVDVSELETLKNNDIKHIDPVQVKGMCTVDKDELIFSFSIIGKMILPCARTLVDVPYSFHFNVTEVFTTSEHIDEEDEENGVHQIFEETLDLKPYIKENIVLEAPYRVFSDEKGLEKGEGWAFYIEDEHQKEKQETIDPRLAKLQKLLNNDEEGKSNK